jgi:hypothetical protein
VLPPEAEPLALALDESLRRPYRAEGLRREGVSWAAGGVRIDVREVDVPGMVTELELVIRPGDEPPFPLERRPPYVLRAYRLEGRFWEVETTPL